MNLLVINSTYTLVEAALVLPQRTFTNSIKHTQASTHLLPMIDSLMQTADLAFKELEAIAVNRGPGPFTTMRSVIATINGLGFALKIPLIGINGIQSFVEAHREEPYTHTIALLNAFCNDVYYAQLEYATQAITSGCCSLSGWLDQFIEFLKQHPTARIKFIGNGCILYQAEIAQAVGYPIINLEEVPEAPSIHAIITSAIQQWDRQENISEQIDPLYFKEYIPRNS